MGGVSRSHFWDVMAGRKNPTLGWMARVASALRREPADLLAGPSLRAVTSRVRKSRQVPLVSLRASAVGFTEPEAVTPAGYINAPSRREVKEGMFAAVMSGKSMEPTIRDGSICLFRPMEGRDPNRKLVLVQLCDATDPETGGAYTLKRFEVTLRRGGQIARVRLEPVNRDYKAMVLEEDPMRQVSVIAEFLEVLIPPAR